MRRSLSIGGSSSVQWQKVGRSWRLRMCFRRLLRVNIEIDQLQCVNCWVIIHCLSVSCTKINHLRCALVIWSHYNWPPNSELLLNNSLLELIYFLNKNVHPLHHVSKIASKITCSNHISYLIIFACPQTKTNNIFEVCCCLKNQIRNDISSELSAVNDSYAISRSIQEGSVRFVKIYGVPKGAKRWIMVYTIIN